MNPGLDPQKLREVRRAWALYGRERSAASAAGVARQTAKRYAPRHNQPGPAAQGYSTWSEPARRRWDAFWSQPEGLHRLVELLGRGR